MVTLPIICMTIDTVAPSLRFDETADAKEKLALCSIFCALMGLETSKHCKRIAQATCLRLWTGVL